MTTFIGGVIGVAKSLLTKIKLLLEDAAKPNTEAYA